MYDIDIEDLSVYYGSVCALKNINLKVKSQKFLGITGPNGGGKTTFIKVLLGLLKPTRGSVFIKRDSVIGYVPQYVFFDRRFPIDVLDTILMGRLPNKIRLFQGFSVEDKKCVQEVMEYLRIRDLSNRQIGQLSGGQMQKVLIARALVSDPKILVLDEPAASLDSSTKKEIYEMLHKLSKDKTIIVVSHDMEEIFSYADNVIFLNKTIQHYKNE